MKFPLLILISLLFFTSCDKPQDPHAGHDHSKHEQHDDHQGHDHSNDEPNETASNNLSTQALENMGVVVQAAKMSDYTITSPVTASVIEDPLNEQVIYAPFAGRIQSINLKTGQEVKSGDLLITIIRAPIKRPELSLVQGILTPASEEYHNSISTLHSTVKSIELLNAEFNRLQQFKNDSNGLSLVPQKEIIDLQYSIANAQQELNNNRSKLKFHGLTDKEVKQIEQGKNLMRTPNLWLNALRQNNIWNNQSSKLLAALAPDIQKNRWVIASIGELSAEELITPELIKYFTNTPDSSRHFLDMTSMLQSGRTLTDIANLNQLGAFERIIEVKTPYTNADLEMVHVTIGQTVESGEKLLTLTKPDQMLLEARAYGSEIAILNDAIRNQFKIAASPLIQGSAIELQGLQISKISNQSHLQSSVLIPVQNSLLNETHINGTKFRNWNLRPGLRYNLHIPTQELTQVIVLPAESIVDHGPDKVVFIRKRNEFLRRKVVIAYQNSDTVVLGKNSELQMGDPVVTRGAFALQLALIAGTPQAVDPHAGHNH